jgi:hypothetical protein
MSFPMPKLNPGQHAVITAELKTGIILSLDGKRWQKGDSSEPWRLFDSLIAAREFATTEAAKNPLIEFGIYDFQDVYIETIRHEKFVA